MLPEPPLKNLERFRALAEAHGQTVRRIYDWGGEYTDEDGIVQYVAPGWDTHLAKEEVQADGKIVVHLVLVSDIDVERGWEKQWEQLIWINEMGFKRVLEEHGYDISES